MDISIIVPLYKGKKYIPNILHMIKENQNVLEENQIKREIEIIFVNDYPAEKIDNEDIPNNSNILIQLYKNMQNLGIHESRVTGLLKATGSYIVFLDQDDELTPFYLWRQLKYIGESDAVLCNGFYRKNKQIYRDEEHQKRTVSKNGYLKQDNFIVSPGQVMIKRESIPDKWKKYILKENGSDDALLWILLLCEEKKFALNLYCDYIHEETSENTSLNFYDMKCSSEEILTVIKGNKLISDNNLLIFKEALKNRINKHRSYAVFLENWSNIIKNIEELCNTNKYKKIAIYGYGVIGKKLLNDLENNGMEIAFIVDKAADSYKETCYKIYEPEYIPEKADLIILTPLFAEKQIKKDLDKYMSTVVSLNELL